MVIVSSLAVCRSVLCDSHSDMLPNDCSAVMAAGFFIMHSDSFSLLHVNEMCKIYSNPTERIFSLHVSCKRRYFPVLSAISTRIMHRNQSCKPSRQTDKHPVLCSPSDHWQYEPGARMCVSAGLLALWQRAGLQKLCLCPHAPHSPHAGGGGGQLMVVCIHFLSICQQFCES